MTAFYQTADGSETQLAIGNDLVPSGERSISLRTDSGAVSINGQETTQAEAYQALNTSSLVANDPLQTRTPTGSPRMGELQSTDIITVGGLDMTVANAESLGLIERGPNGKFLAVPGAADALNREAVPETAPEEGEALADSATEGDLAAICEVVSSGTQVSVLGQLVEAGELHPNTIARAASEAGIHPNEMNERINRVVEGFQHQAEQTIKALGADDPSQFWEWAQENRSRELKDAMRKHGMERSTSAYRGLYGDYVASIADHDAAAVLQADFGTSGITAQQVGQKVLLNIPGIGRVDYQTAVRQGLIRVSGA